MAQETRFSGKKKGPWTLGERKAKVTCLGEEKEEGKVTGGLSGERAELILFIFQT